MKDIVSEFICEKLLVNEKASLVWKNIHHDHQCAVGDLVNLRNANFIGLNEVGVGTNIVCTLGEIDLQTTNRALINQSLQSFSTSCSKSLAAFTQYFD